MNCLIKIALSLLLLFAATPHLCAQQPSLQPSERERAIQLYRQGDFTGSSQILRAFLKKQKNDIAAWHYLGLAQARAGKIGDARKAHEKAAKVGDAQLTEALDRLTIPNKTELGLAADSAEQYLALSGKLSDKKLQEWRDRAESLRFFANQTAGGLELFSGKEVTTKARVLSKPEPTYTEEARRNQTMGTVVLRAVFAADGTVRAIRLISGLGDGLDQRAIDAARHIRFAPATKDGKPVSMWMELQYNFNLY